MAGTVGSPFFQKGEFGGVLFCSVFMFAHPSLAPASPFQDHMRMYVTLEEKNLAYQKLFSIRYDDKAVVNVRSRVEKPAQ